MNISEKHKEAFKILPQNILLGGMAGVLGTSVIFPLYTIKTNLQSQRVLQYTVQTATATVTTNHATGNLANTSASSGLFGKWRVGQIVRNILVREGWRGLYRGLTPSLLGVAPEKAIKLSVNDTLSAILADERGNTSFLGSVMAGAGAGFCQVVATCPMELLMITFQTRAAQSKPVNSVFGLVRELGLRGIYKGAGATLLRDVPFSMIFFSSNAFLRKLFADENRQTGIHFVFLSGITAGCLAAVLSTPMDVIKTRLQSANSSYYGIKDCFVRTLREEGVGKFFSGSVARALIVSPLFGIALLFYEVQKRFLASRKVHIQTNKA
eukprot:jgi/Galph1/2296/GphlegSOOS_G1009.1